MLFYLDVDGQVNVDNQDGFGGFEFLDSHREDGAEHLDLDDIAQAQAGVPDQMSLCNCNYIIM